MRQITQDPSPLRAGLISLMFAGVLLAAFNIPLFGNAPENDGFFSLSSLGRSGLVCLSVLFLTALFWLLALKTRWLRKRFSGHGLLIVSDIVLGWMIYLVAHHLSPQLYYSYYLTLFDGLPVQWVINANIDWGSLGDIVIPGPKERLSDFLACTGFWAVLPYTVLLYRKG